VQCAALQGSGSDEFAANDKDDENTVVVAQVSIEGMNGPVSLFECLFESSETPVPADFAVQVTEAVDPNEMDVIPLPAVEIEVTSCNP
jgi:hypothetical protein